MARSTTYRAGKTATISNPKNGCVLRFRLVYLFFFRGGEDSRYFAHKARTRALRYDVGLFYLRFFFRLFYLSIFSANNKKMRCHIFSGRLIGTTGRGGNEKCPHEQPLLRWYIFIVPRFFIYFACSQQVQPFFVFALSSLALRIIRTCLPSTKAEAKATD